MHGYYDPHPTVTLDRHLVLAGYFGAETRRIAFRLAALTGLGVTDLDRKIEHHAGRSVGELIRTGGEKRYRRMEREHLASLLASRPGSILSLGDGTLIDAANRRRVLAQARLVVLDLDLPGCYWRYRSGASGSREWWHPLYLGPVETFEQLRPYYEQRRPGFAEAHHRIELRGQGCGEVVRRLMAMVEGSEPRSADPAE